MATQAVQDSHPERPRGCLLTRWAAGPQGAVALTVALVAVSMAMTLWAWRAAQGGAEDGLNHAAAVLAAGTACSVLLGIILVWLAALRNRAMELVRRMGEDACRRERHLRTLLNTLPVGVWSADASGIIVDHNPAAERIWSGAPHVGIDGYCQYKARWAETGQLLAPHDWSLARAVREGQASRNELIEIECFDGSRKIIQNSAAPIFDERQRLVGAVAINEDVTERVAAERALRESERFARSIVDAISSHLAILDEDGRIIAVNRAWEGFAAENGADPSRVGVGANYLEVCREAAAAGDVIAQQFLDGVERLRLGTVQLLHLEYPCHSPTRRRWFVARATRLQGPGPIRIVVAHEDITERKQIEDAAAERARALAERDRLRQTVSAQEQVLSVVGHELRTPLAGIRAMAEFLTSEAQRDQQQLESFLKAIQSEAARMADTVDNLLEAARLSSGHVQWQWPAARRPLHPDSHPPLCGGGQQPARPRRHFPGRMSGRGRSNASRLRSLHEATKLPAAHSRRRRMGSAAPLRPAAPPTPPSPP